MNWRFTTIYHPQRIEMGLTTNEYTVFDIIYKSQTTPGYNVNGWSKNSYGELGRFLGISKGAIFKIVERGVEREFLEVDPANPTLKRATKKWYKNAYEDTTSVQKVNDFNTRSKSERSKSERHRSKSERPSVQKVNEIVQKVNAKEVNNISVLKLIETNKRAREENSKNENLKVQEKNELPPVAARPPQNDENDFPQSDEELQQLEAQKNGFFRLLEDRPRHENDPEDLLPDNTIFPFSDFITQYGFPAGLNKAEKIYRILSEDDKAEIKRTVSWYVKDSILPGQRKKEWKPTRKMPANYLEERTWEDYREADGPIFKSATNDRLKVEKHPETKYKVFKVPTA